MSTLCMVVILVFLSGSIGAPIEAQHTDTMSDFLKMLGTGTDAARVDYRGNCDAANPNLIIPPGVAVTKVNTLHRGLSFARTMLANNKDAAVRESAGVTYVRIGAVDASILKTPIKLLILTPDQQYDPSEAIWAVENSPSVQLEMRKRNIHIALAQGSLESIPARGEPHLESAMRNVTLDETLGEVARRFSGTVIYGECQQPNGQMVISIRFIGH